MSFPQGQLAVQEYLVDFAKRGTLSIGDHKLPSGDLPPTVVIYSVDALILEKMTAVSNIGVLKWGHTGDGDYFSGSTGHEVTTNAGVFLAGRAVRAYAPVGNQTLTYNISHATFRTGRVLFFVRYYAPVEDAQ